jgi:hypothetical protein
VSELYNLSEHVAGLVCQALRDRAEADTVGWDIGLQLMPTEQGPQPVIVVFLQLASPLLGQKLNHVVLVDVNDIAPPRINQSIVDALAHLRTRRSELLAQPGQLEGGLAAQRAAALGQHNGQQR